MEAKGGDGWRGWHKAGRWGRGFSAPPLTEIPSGHLPPLFLSEIIPFLSLKQGDNCPAEREALIDPIFVYFPHNFPVLPFSQPSITFTLSLLLPQVFWRRFLVVFPSPPPKICSIYPSSAGGFPPSTSSHPILPLHLPLAAPPGVFLILLRCWLPSAVVCDLWMVHCSLSFQDHTRVKSKAAPAQNL